MNKLIILDRDGVINQNSSNYIRSPEAWIPIPGSLEAIALLNKHDFKVAIATNQSGISRGYYAEEILQEMHEKMFNCLNKVNGKIDKLVYCPHLPEDNCSCRKPKTGMLKEIFKFFDINPNKETIYFVGDSLSDIEAAKAANCIPVLVTTGNGNKTMQQLGSSINPIKVFPDLMAFVKSLLTAV